MQVQTTGLPRPSRVRGSGPTSTRSERSRTPYLGRLKSSTAGPVLAHDPDVERVRHILQPPRIKIHDRALEVLVQRLDSRPADRPGTDNDHLIVGSIPSRRPFVQVSAWRARLQEISDLPLAHPGS